MAKLFFALAFSAIVAIQAGPLPTASDWNSLLFADDIFSNDIKSILSKSLNKEETVSELTTLLNDESVLSELYKNYLASFKDNGLYENGRMNTFKDSLVEIASHNLEALAGMHSWFKGVNMFTDLAEEEGSAFYKGASTDLIEAFGNLTGGKFVDVETQIESPLPPSQQNSVDWKTAGKVSSVKNQGQCGSCVTFATTATLESLIAISSDSAPVDYSPQEVLDCSDPQRDICKNGMYLKTAMDYLQSNGVTLWEDYPYEGSQMECRSESKTRAAQFSSFAFLDTNENAMKNAVAQGPIAVLLRASPDFKKYQSGIFTGMCYGNVDHAVVIVGYGNSGGKDYWLIKNSWGVKTPNQRGWGEEGYMRMQRGRNLCNVNKFPAAGQV